MARSPAVGTSPGAAAHWIELVALRRRGLSQPIHVTADGLPDGLDCPDVWFGPDVDRVPMIVSSSRDASREPRAFRLTGVADLGGIEITHEARGTTLLSTGPPTASARLTGRTVAATGPEAAGLPDGDAEPDGRFPGDCH